MEILFHNETATIGYHQSFQYIWIEWTYFVQGESYKMIMDEVLGFMLLKNSSKLLINQTHKDFLYLADTHWAVQEWLPVFAQKVGSEAKLAVVFSEKNVPLSLTKPPIIQKMRSKVFVSWYEAEGWLAEETLF